MRVNDILGELENLGKDQYYSPYLGGLKLGNFLGELIFLVGKGTGMALGLKAGYMGNWENSKNTAVHGILHTLLLLFFALPFFWHIYALLLE